jgi:Domain of unknown function (DUF1844)
MSNPPAPETGQPDATPEDMISAVFAQMIMQQSNIAMMLLGKVPNPQTGKSMRDLEGARLFIDQLEMLEVKTKGNLSKEEEALLRQSLMTLRLWFVEAADAAPASEKPSSIPEAPAPAAATEAAPQNPDATAASSESSKKFSKKY